MRSGASRARTEPLLGDQTGRLSGGRTRVFSYVDEENLPDIEPSKCHSAQPISFKN